MTILKEARSCPSRRHPGAESGDFPMGRTGSRSQVSFVPPFLHLSEFLKLLVVRKARPCISNDLTDSNCPVSSQSNGTGHNHEQAGGHRTIETEIETLEYYRTFLARLLDFVSHGEPEAVDRLFQFIRSGASQEQIFEMLAELRAVAGSRETENRG
ncbi:hypothetical protein BDV11DRAFT_208823 [Aspergillus similis]